MTSLPPNSPAPNSQAASRLAPSSPTSNSAAPPAPPLRAMWVRPLALLILVFVLPLDWTRTDTSGCGASTPVRIQTGYQHLFVTSEVGVFVSALALVSLTMLWSAHKNLAWRLFFSGAALLINVMLAGLVVFAAMFQLFNKVEVLPGGWLAFTTCGVLAVEPLVRFIAEVARAIESFRERRRRKRLAELPGPKPP